MTAKKQKKRRTAVKKMTKEAHVLKFMRESRGLSMRKAAKIIGVSDAQISHAENGRRDLSPDFILRVITGYGYDYQEFLDFLTGKKEVPQHLFSECVNILRRLDHEKLKTVKTILESL